MTKSFPIKKERIPAYRNQYLWITCECEKGRVYGPWFEKYTLSLNCIDCKPTHHRWAMCSMCGAMVICAKCGNNSCNAGDGTINGKPCNACSDAYELKHLGHANKMIIPLSIRIKNFLFKKKKILILRYYILRAKLLNFLDK